MFGKSKQYGADIMKYGSFPRVMATVELIEAAFTADINVR